MDEHADKFKMRSSGRNMRVEVTKIKRRLEALLVDTNTTLLEVFKRVAMVSSKSDLRAVFRALPQLQPRRADVFNMRGSNGQPTFKLIGKSTRYACAHF